MLQQKGRGAAQKQPSLDVFLPDLGGVLFIAQLKGRGGLEAACLAASEWGGGGGYMSVSKLHGNLVRS